MISQLLHLMFSQLFLRYLERLAPPPEPVSIETAPRCATYPASPLRACDSRDSLAPVVVCRAAPLPICDSVRVTHLLETGGGYHCRGVGGRAVWSWVALAEAEIPCEACLTAMGTGARKGVMS